MILRRLATAFRKQDWFTVVIETLIVVFGVFIGLQVNNWNAARGDQVDARVALERLEQDFEQNLERADRALAAHAESLAAGSRLINGIRGGQLDEGTLLTDVTIFFILAAPPGPSTTYTELVSSGRLELIENESLRSSLTQYDDFIIFVRGQYGSFEEPINDAQTTLMQAITLQVTGIPATEFEDLFRSESVDREMLLSNPEMMATLQNAYGTQDNIHVFLTGVRGQIRDILDQIRAERGRVK